MRFKDFFEAPTTTKDQTGVDLGIDLDGPKSKGDLTKAERPSDKKSDAKTSRKTASAATTTRKVATATIDPNKVPDFNPDDLDMSAEIDDDEAARRAGHGAAPTHGAAPEIKPTSQNLPAIIQTALATLGKKLKGIDPADIEWHMVKHLPGYLAKPIRTMGRKVFEPFTKTPIEDIQVIANVGGGPNTDAEINAISKYVTSHGTRERDIELAFEKVLPGYNAQVVVYNCLGYTFFLVKDFAGNYIYSWPEKDTSLPEWQKQLGHDAKQLAHDGADELNAMMKKYGI